MFGVLGLGLFGFRVSGLGLRIQAFGSTSLKGSCQRSIQASFKGSFFRVAFIHSPSRVPLTFFPNKPGK